MVHVGIKGFEIETSTESPNNWKEPGRAQRKLWIFKLSIQFKNLKQFSSVTDRRFK